MNRLEKFRQIRHTKAKYMLSFLLFFLLLIPGICAADYAVNNIMKNEKGIEVVKLKQLNTSYIEFNLMNQKYYINVSYVKRDYQNIKRMLKEHFYPK